MKYTLIFNGIRTKWLVVFGGLPFLLFVRYLMEEVIVVLADRRKELNFKDAFVGFQQDEVLTQHRRWSEFRQLNLVWNFIYHIWWRFLNI